MLRTKELKSVVAELKIKDVDIKSHTTNLEEVKQSLVEARKEASKQVRKQVFIIFNCKSELKLIQEKNSRI